MLMRLIEPTCNLSTVKDLRGGIFTFFPEQGSIAEWSYMITKPGKVRGFHWHKEFDEYVHVIDGEGVYIEWDLEKNEESGFVKMSSGNCIYFPSGCAHTLHSITQVKMVAMLTKKWDDCDEPLTRVD
jgi:dTDP-4-dehydrorhamnose 3,5-epimerase-like enzyme